MHFFFSRRLLSAVLLLCFLFAGCSGADPTPFTRFEHENVLLTKLPTDAGAVKFIALGDWGRRGFYYQTEVAEQMGVVAGSVDADFIATTGDNFYPSGVGSVYDAHWRESFEEVYDDAALFLPWYPTLGNHDYRGSIEAQVAYSEVSARWKMPAPYYAFTREIDDTTRAQFVFIDTPLLVPERVEAVPAQQAAARRQLAWIDSTLASTNAQWKIVVGHHPLYSAGKHGNDSLLTSMLRPILEGRGVQLYLAGHDHNLQYLETEDLDQVVTGGGSRLRKVGANRLAVFAITRPGFALVSLAAEQILVQFVDHRGNILYGEVIEHPMRPEHVPEPVEADDPGTLQQK